MYNVIMCIIFVWLLLLFYFHYAISYFVLFNRRFVRRIKTDNVMFESNETVQCHHWQYCTKRVTGVLSVCSKTDKG